MKGKRRIMKEAEKDKPVRTIPNGVWEGSRPGKQENQSETRYVNKQTTDAQGNGYPIPSKREK